MKKREDLLFYRFAWDKPNRYKQTKEDEDGEATNLAENQNYGHENSENGQ